MRVLVADDDRATRSLLRLYLTKWGYECDLAEDGETALKLAQERPYDIVLSDWRMPGIDGPELCQRIRSSRNSAYTYIILCTVNGETQKVVGSLQAGADDFVTKPFNREELRARIDAGARVVEQQRALADENNKLTQVMRQAADTLENLLPAPRRGPDVNLDWLFRPSTYIGGDIFNTFMIDESHTGVYAIDVCGHGVTSALFAVSLRNMLRPPVAAPEKTAPGIGQVDFRQPSDVATALNQLFSTDEQSPDMYFTMFYGVIDHRQRAMRWVRAGHPPPVVVSESTRCLEDGDQPIGLFPDVCYREHRDVFAPGDRLFLYSDGIIEAMSPEREFFGLERLVSMFMQTRGEPLDRVVEQVGQAVIAHQQRPESEDDISLLAVEIL